MSQIIKITSHKFRPGEDADITSPEGYELSSSQFATKTETIPDGYGNSKTYDFPVVVCVWRPAKPGRVINVHSDTEQQ